MKTLSLAINRFFGRIGDTTPGGASDVWMWEGGIGLLWEPGISMLRE